MLAYQAPFVFPSPQLECEWLVTAPHGERVYARILSFRSGGNGSPGSLTFQSFNDNLDGGFAIYSPDDNLLDVVSPVDTNELTISMSSYAPYNDDSLLVELSTITDNTSKFCRCLHMSC